MKNKGYVILLSIFLVLVFFASSVNPALIEPDHSNADMITKVIGVIDGDTVEIASGENVRYIGLDTPETKDQKKPKEYFGAYASRYNRKLVGRNRVKLEFDVEKRDKYGRLLAYVYAKIGDQWVCVNSELLRKGFARLYTKPPNNRYTDYFLAMERKARKNCKGLWKIYCEGLPVFESEAIEEKLGEYEGKVVSVRYRVASTYNSGEVMYLNSSNNYQEDFTAVIFADDLKYFSRSGIFPGELEGVRIQVTGELQRYNGPEIVLYHPYQLDQRN